MQDYEQLCGTVEHIVYENSETGYTVIELEAESEIITAVGELGSVNEGEDVVLHGAYINHPSFGRQFKAQFCEVSLPKSESAIIKYLSSGALPYIGPAMAKKIVDCFKGEALEVIAGDVDRLARIKGLSLKRAQNISMEFNKVFGIREAIAWLSRFGIAAGQAVAVYKLYGADTIKLIAQDPYLLCFGGIDISFKAADAIAAELQINEESDRRLSAAVLYILRHNLQNGHTCLPVEKLVETTSGFIGVEKSVIMQSVLSMKERSELEIVDFDNKRYIYLPDMYTAERNISAHLAFLAKLPQEPSLSVQSKIDINESVTGITYAPLQREAITAALSQRALVLTGGPGTGKTTAVNAMISCLEAQGERVALAAPTGRAAKRLSELTGKKAQTIHRLLEVDFTNENLVRFIHNEKNKLRCEAIIIDEMSMVDTLLFDSLLAALKSNCRIIMVGDEDQLPSVGAGSVLSGVIASNAVHTVRLKEIFRQAAQSLIVSNAHRIVNGDIPQKGDKNSDFFIMEADAYSCAELVPQLVAKRLPAAYGYGLNDVQVLCPTKIGVLGTIALNERLQQILNPPAPNKKQIQAYGRIYREGDKVMQIKNNYDITFVRDNGEDGVCAFNGDMGIIESIDLANGTIVVRSEDKRYIYTNEMLVQLETAYAVTIHKSQGSEFPAVLIPLGDTPQKLCYRNLLYTGVTRAKQLCILAGSAQIISKMVANSKNTRRFSCLAQLLNREAGL